jgi:DNA modification methylase
VNKSPFVNQLLLSDCVKATRLLPNDSIDLTVTSPAYDRLREYGGHSFDFDYLAEELYRITVPGGIVVWIVQEQVFKGEQSGSSSYQRCLFKEVGFRLFDVMPMVINGMRMPQKRRYVNRYHQAIVLSKGRPRVVNILRDRPNKHAGKLAKGKKRFVDGRLHSLPVSTIREVGERGNVWLYDAGGTLSTKERYAYAHPAIMPEMMAEDHILSWSRPGDIVFDPFCGSGTTCKMALLNHRKYLGVEINRNYFDIATRRLKEAEREYALRLDSAIAEESGVKGQQQNASYLPSDKAVDSFPKNRSTGKRWEILKDDVMQSLLRLESSSVDAAFLDGPYGLGFMDKSWDAELPSTDIFRQLLRVCKPGAFLLAFGGPRTFHRLTSNIEDSGWEIRDVISWLYGQGFPKGLNLSKAIDKQLGVEGVEQEVVQKSSRGRKADHRFGFRNREFEIKPPESEQAQIWQGYSTALKPGWEPIILAQAPRANGFAANALDYGCGGLNIDSSRIGAAGGTQRSHQAEYPSLPNGDEDRTNWARSGHFVVELNNGRWPANVLLDAEAAAELDRQSGKSRSRRTRRRNKEANVGNGVTLSKFQSRIEGVEGYDDQGGPSRFFYTAKASKDERRGNEHPTLKPLKLCEYLARLILPPARGKPRKLLVPYCGSGSEMIGALMAGWDQVIGIERDQRYVEIAEKRLSELIE